MECKFILDKCGKMSHDPSCDAFVRRDKHHAFVKFLENGEAIRSEQDWFCQPDQYNDFNGGFNRRYSLIPMEVVQSPELRKAARAYQDFWKLPKEDWLFINIQINHFDEDSRGKCPTGQGIHSDGANHGGIVVLSRENIIGATNSIYNDLKGEDRVFGPVDVQPGEMILWKDNKIFHEVSPATLQANKTKGSRAVIVILDAAEMFMTGIPNPDNTLGRNEFPDEHKLRFQKEHNEAASDAASPPSNKSADEIEQERDM